MPVHIFVIFVRNNLSSSILSNSDTSNGIAHARLILPLRFNVNKYGRFQILACNSQERLLPCSSPPLLQLVVSVAVAIQILCT